MKRSFWEAVAKHYENHTQTTRLQNAKPAQRATALGRNDARKTPRARRPHVRFTLCRTRLLDVDAKYDSIKDLLDGLQYAGLIPGDREDQITLEVEQIKVAHRKDEMTRIEIENIDDKLFIE